VVSERERQPEQAGQLRAVPAGAEQPHRRHVAASRRRGDPRRAVTAGEQLDQAHELLRELFGVQPLHRAAQRQRGDLVGARRAADAQVDPARVQRLQRAELLGHHQRRVVGQHHAARADPDRRGRRGQVGDQHGRGRAGDGRHVVMLGHPEPPVSEFLGTFSQLSSVAQRIARRRPGGDGGQVQNGKGYLGHIARQPVHVRVSSAAPSSRWHERRQARLSRSRRR
jgi:hypothetical protein